MTYLPRVQHFGSGAVKLNARPGEALPLDDIRAHAPAIFAEQPHESRSERFAHIPTHHMLEGLIKEGFMPTSVTVGGSRDEAKRGFTKHMIRLRRMSDVITSRSRQVGDVYPEVVLQNGHDGTSQYRLMFGLFRLACLNGLVVADSTVGDVKVPHRGDAISKVIEGSYEVIEHATDVMGQVEAMRAVTLNVDEATVFARSALAARFGEEVPEELEQDPRRILKARRTDDQLPDLWTTYNRAQENLIRGGITYTTVRGEGRQAQVIHNTTRPVKSVDGDIKLNRALWLLAEGMKSLKGGA